MAKITRKYLENLPKADLHCHLDGSLRIKTIIELAKEYKVKLPTYDEEGLAKLVQVGQTCSSLEEYLKAFDITLAVLQEKDALIRTAYELAEDAAKENVKYMEVRYSPILHTKRGLKLTEIVDGVKEGLELAEKKFDIITGIIICGIRQISPETSLHLADLCVAYKNRGVVGFDLAGAEANYPAKHHKEAFYRILNNNINCTLHAGEAFGADSIAQAIHYCGAHRIGHGTRLSEDGDLLNYVNDHRIPLEICLTSNVQTRSVKNYESHPIKLYYTYGLRVTLNTDNRLVSNTTLTDELLIAARTYNFTSADIKSIIIHGFKSAFLSYRDKKRLLQRIIPELDPEGELIFPREAPSH